MFTRVVEPVGWHRSRAPHVSCVCARRSFTPGYDLSSWRFVTSIVTRYRWFFVVSESFSVFLLTFFTFMWMADFSVVFWRTVSLVRGLFVLVMWFWCVVKLCYHVLMSFVADMSTIISELQWLRDEDLFALSWQNGKVLVAKW